MDVDRMDLSDKLKASLDAPAQEVSALPGAVNTFIRTGTCCDKPLAKAIRDGKLGTDVERWTCEKCGCTWLPVMIGAFRTWEPHPIIEVHRGRRR